MQEKDPARPTRPFRRRTLIEATFTPHSSPSRRETQVETERPDPAGRFKQVIVVDASLALPPGKLAAQVAHAAVAALLGAAPEWQRAWFEQGMPKIVLAARNGAELERLEAQARSAALPCHLIADAGRTVLEPGTVTCLGIGPAPADRIDRLTGTLPLLR